MFEDKTDVELFTVLPASEPAKEAAPDRAKTGRIFRMRNGITIDSGAGNSVMPRITVIIKDDIRESEGSRAGLHYVAANDGRIPNEGEYDLKFHTTEGNSENFIF